jgi:hypothetical protein
MKPKFYVIKYSLPGTAVGVQTMVIQATTLYAAKEIFAQQNPKAYFLSGLEKR